jgi:protein-S-isoprenylcysteine O-methyltransferase Ste14
MFTAVRAILYATLFISFVFLYVPGRILTRMGVAHQPAIVWPQIAGMLIGGAGAMIALWCVIAFVRIGKGTPAPFDPPRRLVIRGPYRFVRNPMYIGGALAIIGITLFYESLALLVYGGILLLGTHLLVVFYEEPALRCSFGQEYEMYCHRVRRWQPGAAR